MLICPVAYVPYVDRGSGMSIPGWPFNLICDCGHEVLKLNEKSFDVNLEE